MLILKNDHREQVFIYVSAQDEYPFALKYFGKDSLIVETRSTHTLTTGKTVQRWTAVARRSYAITETKEPRGSFSACTGGVLKITEHGAFNKDDKMFRISRATPPEQDYTYTEGGRFPAKSHENILSKMAASVQDVKHRLQDEISGMVTSEAMEELTAVWRGMLDDEHAWNVQEHEGIFDRFAQAESTKLNAAISAEREWNVQEHGKLKEAVEAEHAWNMREHGQMQSNIQTLQRVSTMLMNRLSILGELSFFDGTWNLDGTRLLNGKKV